MSNYRPRDHKVHIKFLKTKEQFGQSLETRLPEYEAKILAKALVDSGNFEVLMTRESEETVEF